MAAHQVPLKREPKHRVAAMKLRTPVIFIFQSVTIGLAIAFLVLVWRPELVGGGQRVVEFVQSNAPPMERIASGSAPVSYAPAVEIAAPAVVNINTSKLVAERAPLFNDPFFRHFFGDDPAAIPRERLETSLGSGVIVSADGYILTNNHVIEGADEIAVSLRDGRNAQAKVVGTDPESDLAVLKIELPNLPVITIGRSEELRVGDVVLAIGNPYGVGQTVTQGIVSGTERRELGISTFENFIQTDAAINPGNSGGALVTARGELVGINTAIFSRTGGSQGIGFAIPMSLVQGIMAEIVEKGRVTRGWLGVEIQEITPELAESFGLREHDGVIVAGVLRGGPAAKAGIQPGDILTHINGSPIQGVRDALNLISSADPGTLIDVGGIRDARDFELRARVSERPMQSP